MTLNSGIVDKLDDSSRSLIVASSGNDNLVLDVCSLSMLTSNVPGTLVALIGLIRLMRPSRGVESNFSLRVIFCLGVVVFSGVLVCTLSKLGCAKGEVSGLVLRVAIGRLKTVSVKVVSNGSSPLDACSCRGVSPNKDESSLSGSC